MGKHFIVVFPCTTQIALFSPKLLPALLLKIPALVEALVAKCNKQGRDAICIWIEFMYNAVCVCKLQDQPSIRTHLDILGIN
jgi:hypothetical protein